MNGATVARNTGGVKNLCGASMPCGDQQGLLAYAISVGSRKTPVTGFERAIGARIREARERLGVSITELGLAWGGSRQKVQFWERGDHFPPLSEFPKLCQLLRTDANSLLGIHAMKPLTEQEKISAKTQIQSLARAQKNEVAGVRSRKPERLQRRAVAAR